MTSKVRVPVLKHQNRFCTTEAKHPCLVGGYGAGKTRGFIYRAIAELTHPLNRGKWGLLAEPTYRMVRDVLARDLLDILAGMGIPYEYSRTDLSVSTPYGIILLRSAENWERWRSLNLAWGGIDEIAQLRTAEPWNMLLSRIRKKGTLRAFASTTPEGFNFVYDLWGKDSLPGYEIIRAKTTDNLYLPQEYIESLKQNYPERMVKQYLDGEFVILSGGVYAEYGELNNTVFKNTDGFELVFAADFGYRRPAILAVRIEPGPLPRYHVVDEIRLRDVTTDVAALRMREWCDSHGVRGPVTVYCDPAGAAMSSTSSVTDIQLLEGRGFRVEYCLAPQLRSIQTGVTILQSLFCSSTGVRRMFVDRERCPDLHRSLMGYRYDERGVPIKDGVNDHDCDALRYLVINREPIAQPRWTFGSAH